MSGVLPCGCGHLTCPYCNPHPANLHYGRYNFTPNTDNEGWRCPVCKHVYSPATPECLKCNKESQ